MTHFCSNITKSCRVHTFFMLFPLLCQLFFNTAARINLQEFSVTNLIFHVKSAWTNKYRVASDLNELHHVSTPLIADKQQRANVHFPLLSRSPFCLCVKSVPTSLISKFTLDQPEEHELHTSLCSLLFLFLCLLPLTLLEASSIFGSVRDARSCLDPLGYLCSHFISLLAALVLTITWSFPCQALPGSGSGNARGTSDHLLRGKSNLFSIFVTVKCFTFTISDAVSTESDVRQQS